MNRNSVRSQAGVSLVEILIVVVISGILVAFSVTQLGRSRENFRRQAIAREFKTSLERARFDSVKRHAVDASTMAQLTITSATSYTLTLDLNQNGTIEASETRTIDFSGTPGVRLFLPSGRSFPVLIQFDQRGHAISNDLNNLLTDHFVFCDAGCTLANANNQNSNVVYVSTTGTVSMLGGSDSVPTIATPSTSTVASNTGINPDLTVFTGSLPTPTPGSPTPTPGTPTPTPSPTPTPVTPTPTPPPLPSCSSGQRPGSPATCRCDAPKFIGSNGKCA